MLGGTGDSTLYCPLRGESIQASVAKAEGPGKGGPGGPGREWDASPLAWS